MAVTKLKRLRLRIKGLHGIGRHPKRRLKNALSQIAVSSYNHSDLPTKKERLAEAVAILNKVVDEMAAMAQRIIIKQKQSEALRAENYATLKAEFDAARAAGRTYNDPEQRSEGRS